MARCTAEPAACQRRDIRPRIGSEHQDSKEWIDRLDCPICGAPKKLTLTPGEQHRFVWKCHASDCDPADIRAWLLERVTADHLGNYARFRRPAPKRTDADALAEIEKILTGPAETPAILRIRIGAALWCGGRVPDDWLGLLALAERAGVGRRQRYEAAARMGATRGP